MKTLAIAPLIALGVIISGYAVFYVVGMAFGWGTVVH